MAKIVAGMAFPHGPQASAHWSKWHEFEQRDRNHPQLRAEPAVTFDELVAQAPPGLGDVLDEAHWKDAYERAQQGRVALREILHEAAPDVIVAVGDDQHEHLLDDNMPPFCVYWGESLATPQRQRNPERRQWLMGTNGGGGEDTTVYPAAPELARHTIKGLIRQGFDVATSNQLKPEVGLGHAFRAVYRLTPEAPIPMLPVMVNTFYPPNQPPPARCYAFGQALRKAIETWDTDARVAIVGSGGLSHVVLDEEVDQLALEAIRRQDAELIAELPEERLIRGTSEIRNWIVVAGAMEGQDFNLVDYIAAYRNTAAMGHGLAYAYWS